MYMHCNNNVQKPFISNMKRICTMTTMKPQIKRKLQMYTWCLQEIDQVSAPKFGGNVYFGSHVRGSYHSWARDKHFSLARCPGEDLRLSIYHASKIKWCINYQHKLKMKTADHLSSSLPAVLKQYVPEYEPTVPV